MKKVFILVVLFILSGCAVAGGTDPSIKANPESDYEKTYKDLGIGQIHDFEFTLPKAGERWVRVWVEGYHDGKKIEEPLVEISYGKNPDQTEKGQMGIGIIRGGGDGTLLHLYAPGVSLMPRESPLPLNDPGISTWEYAIGEEGIKLVLGEEVLLGAYRQSSSGTMEAFDLQNAAQVKRMIKQDTTVLLLKIKVDNDKDHQGNT
ncbi:hypothetical protein ACJA3J_07380 [Halobacillus sp. SY10]|uniref:Lipoprotein n=1 Tax=Halobacillus trueperi TaxID=156205 RepID=A0A3D8VP08_9BACI|nr:hypothetical protein [Halobacillus trueperi]RDY71134.1 hypothetical protein DXT76_09210 [Halobacillus trueperi]